MSSKLKAIKTIENLTVQELRDALEYNGYPEVGNAVLRYKVSGKEFLKLQESDIRSWKLNPVKTIHFRSFFLRVVEYPEDFLIKSKETTMMDVEEKNCVVEMDSKSKIKNDHYIKTQSAVNGVQAMSNKPQSNLTLPPKPKNLKSTQEQTENCYLMKKNNTDNISSSLNEGYLLPNYFEEPDENYEPAPIINVKTNSYREIKMEVQKKIFNKNNLQSLKDRPLPALPPLPSTTNICSTNFVDLNGEEESDENLPVYIEIDEKNITQGIISNEPLQKTGNLHLLLKHELKQRDSAKNMKITPKSTNLPTPPKSFPIASSDLLEKPENKLQSLNNFVRQHNCKKSPEVVRKSNEKSFKDLISDIQNSSFYRDTDRKGARIILAGLIDGAFLIRPPSKSYFLSVIVVKKGKKFFNIGIEQTPGEMSLQVNSVGDTQTFDNIAEIIDNFCKEPLVILDNESNEKVEVLLKKVL